MSLEGSISGFRDFLDVLPLCIAPTSKTTVINDPTAGMTPEEITNYLDNVGGGMCGYPDSVRTIIGLGLNLSLIVFGVFTVSYVILGAITFVVEKRVDDLIKAEDANYPDMNENIEPMQYMGENSSYDDENTDADTDVDNNNYSENRKSKASTRINSPTGMNRQERRMKNKISDNKNK